MTFNPISSSVREASMDKISKLESLSESNLLRLYAEPYEFVRGNSRWSQHLNGHIFYAKPEILQSGKDVKRIL